MLKKTVTYEDFNGEPTTEDLFFHFSQAELVEMELSEVDGMSVALQKIIDTNDGKKIIAEFKKIILSAYGKRSEDGKRFIKNDQVREEFESSEAYSALFMELVTDTNSAIEFVKGVIPQQLVEQATAAIEDAQKPSVLAPVPEPLKVTKAEIHRMSAEDIQTLGESIAAGEAEIVD